MRNGSVIELICDATKELACAHIGQRATVYLANADGSLNTVLSCGHPWTAVEGTYKVIEEAPEPIPEPKKALLPEAKTRVKENKMPRRKNNPQQTELPMKQGVIPNSQGIIPVQGYESQVKRFKTNLRFYEQLEEQVEQDKIFFRNLTDVVLSKVSGPAHRVEFLSDDGSIVPVTVPDVTKAGNRVNLRPEITTEAAQLGVDLSELNVLETETTIVLRGAMVEWFRTQVIQPSYTAHGLAIPVEIEEKSVTRLSESGVAKLATMAKEAVGEKEREAAKLILKGGIKAASVTAK